MAGQSAASRARRLLAPPARVVVGDELVVEFPLGPRVVRASDDIDGVSRLRGIREGPARVLRRGSTSPASTPSGTSRCAASAADRGARARHRRPASGRPSSSRQARARPGPPWPYFDPARGGGQGEWQRATVASTRRRRPRGARHSLLCLGQQGRHRHACLGARAPLKPAEPLTRASCSRLPRRYWTNDVAVAKSPGLRKGFPSCFQKTLRSHSR